MQQAFKTDSPQNLHELDDISSSFKLMLSSSSKSFVEGRNISQRCPNVSCFQNVLNDSSIAIRSHFMSRNASLGVVTEKDIALYKKKVPFLYIFDVLD